MIQALVWGTDRNQYFDSEYIKTILCKGEEKIVYPTYILAFIDGIYKSPVEDFRQAADRFISDRITKLTARVTSTVIFLNNLDIEWRRQRPQSSLLLKYQTRLNNPEIFINNINYPSANMLTINENFIPNINNNIPDSPPCNLVAAAARPAVAALPAVANQYALRLAGGRFGGTMNYRNRKTRAKKYKARKTRKIRK